MKSIHTYWFLRLTLVIFSIVSAVEAQTGNFAPSVFYNVGPLPYGMTSGDFNGDGKPDLASANLAGNSISVLINNGDGTFQNQVLYPVGASPTSVTAGDFNNDNRVDLAVANFGSGFVGVLLGNGNGTFQSQVGYGTFGRPQHVIATDLNNDNKLDLVTANFQSFRVAVLLGNGNGTFQGPTGYTVAGTESFLTAADFNQDGNQDIAVTCPGALPNLYVLFGNGNGTLQPPVGYIANSNPIGFRAANLNADNYPDLVVGNMGGGFQISVLINNGDGTFQPPVSYSTITMLNPDVTIADFNLDGKPDIAAAGSGTPTYISVFHGNGDGTFQTGISIQVHGGSLSPSAITSADFDGNNQPDIAMVNYNSSNVAVLLNQCVTCDTTAPTTTAAPDSSANAAGWHNTDVGILLSATDDTNGNGVKQITYSASGAQTIAPTIVSGASANLLITEDGETIISYYAEDNAGNVEETQTLVVRIDKTAPSVSCGTADSVWHASDVSISCTAEENVSQLENNSDASFNLVTSVPAGTETANAMTDSRQVCDIAGNCATAGAIGGNKVDKKAPTISLTSPTAGNYLLNQAVTVDFDCSDGGSGIADCSGTTPDGNPLDTASVGNKTFTVNATDNVGNSASPTVINYTVNFGIQVLFDQTRAHKSGSTVPIKIRLVDANGANVSSAGTVVHAVSVVLIATQASTVLDDAGNSNPDFDFRYDAQLSGYIFNLKTTNYVTGTYQLNYIAGSGSTIYSVQFQVRQ